MTNKSRKLNESDHPNVLEATGSDKEIGKKPGVRSNRENEEEVGKSGFRKWDGIRDIDYNCQLKHERMSNREKRFS